MKKILRRFRSYRRYKGGMWISTKYRGWITNHEYNFYLGYKFDPIMKKHEEYE